MYKKTVQTLILLTLLSFTSCVDDAESLQNNDLKNRISSQVLEEAPMLGVADAVYSLLLTNHSPNMILSDDFYIVKSIANVSFGYEMSEIEMNVSENGKTLIVKLPNYKQIAIDRRDNQITTVHDSYNPVDEKGKTINVDKRLNTLLDEALKNTQSKNAQEVKKLTKLYFARVAAKYGLSLELK